MEIIRQNKKITIIAIIYLIYFSTKLFWDSFTNVFELLSIGTLGIFSFLQLFLILKSRQHPIYKFLIYWGILILYIVLNSVFNSPSIHFFTRTLYEYIFYSLILWTGYFFAKYIDFNKMICIFSIVGIFIAILSFIEFTFDFYIIPMENYSTYVEFNGEMITRAKVFTRSYLSHGVLLGIFSLCNYYLFMQNKKNFYFLGAIFCYISILTTSSRGPLVATTVALLSLNIQYIKNIFINAKKNWNIKYLINILLFVFLLGAILLGNFETGIDFVDYCLLRIRSIFNWTGDPGNVGRLEIWSKWVQTIKDNFIFGIGPCITGSWDVITLGVTESDILKKLVELGIFGFILYYFYICNILYYIIIKIKDLKINLCLSIVLTILIDSIILQVSEEIMVSFYLWFFMGLGLFYSVNYKNISSNQKEKTILYFSNVDWYWIKQRPQFIAEGLAKKYNTIYIYQYRYNRKIMQKNNKVSNNDIYIIPFYVIPKGDNYSLLLKVNEFIKKIYITTILFFEEIDILYLTYPTQINSIPNCYKNKIIYDCMDNHINFIADEVQKERVKLAEEQLLNKATHILCSSNKLINELRKRYNLSNLNNIALVRNAFQGEIIDKPISIESRTTLNICYFGTVASWFNYQLLLNNVKENQNVKYWIIGPIENGMKFEKHPNITFMGIVNHQNLYKETKKMDCFIMPFIPNDIVESVDPVKFYEYINFNKNIISIYYDEISRFEPFVYFYKNQEEFNELIKFLYIENKMKYSNSQRVEFLKANNWNSRINQIENIIEGKM